jgi:hypothetical protein
MFRMFAAQLWLLDGRWRAVLALCTALAAPAVWAAEPFGVVEFATGSASVVDAQGQTRPAQAQDKLAVGDTLVTGRDGELHVRTEDNGYVALRANSRMRVDSYQAHAAPDDNYAVSLLVGAMRSISGWIGKVKPAAYQIKTPTATIGIRGTDHETYVVAPAEGGAALPPGMQAGTYDKVNSGATVIQTDKGSVDVAPNQSGFVPHGGGAAPRTLARVPGFFKKSRFEGRIDRRSQMLAANQEKHRAQRARQKAAEQKRADKAEKAAQGEGPHGRRQPRHEGGAKGK